MSLGFPLLLLSSSSQHKAALGTLFAPRKRRGICYVGGIFLSSSQGAETPPFHLYFQKILQVF